MCYLGLITAVVRPFGVTNEERGDRQKYKIYGLENQIKMKKLT